MREELVLATDEPSDEYRLNLDDPAGWMSFSAKWDGCVDLNVYYNRPFTDRDMLDPADTDYIHICNLRQFIERLEEVERRAKAHFQRLGCDEW
jgi:hypothetical protein